MLRMLRLAMPTEVSRNFMNPLLVTAIRADGLRHPLEYITAYYARTAITRQMMFRSFPMASVLLFSLEEDGVLKRETRCHEAW